MRRSLCSQTSTRGTWNAKHPVLFLQGKECRTHYLPRRLEADVRSSLVIFALSVWPETMMDLPQIHIIVFLSQSIEPSLWKVSHGLYKAFLYSQMQSLLGLLCSSERFMHALLCARDSVSITRKFAPNCTVLKYA